MSKKEKLQNKKTVHNQQDSTEPAAEKHFLPLSKEQIGWFTALIVLAFIWLVYPGYGQTFNIFQLFRSESSEVYVDDGRFARENIDLVGNWTLDIYDSLEIATVNYDNDYEVESYHGGADYFELVEQVGRPSSTYRDDWTGFETINATWDYNGNNEYISIDITYLEENGMIIDKYIYGSQY